jgi:hypothetical protein
MWLGDLSRPLFSLLWSVVQSFWPSRRIFKLSLQAGRKCRIRCPCPPTRWSSMEGNENFAAKNVYCRSSWCYTSVWCGCGTHTAFPPRTLLYPQRNKAFARYKFWFAVGAHRSSDTPFPVTFEACQKTSVNQPFDSTSELPAYRTSWRVVFAGTATKTKSIDGFFSFVEPARCFGNSEWWFLHPNRFWITR